MRNEESPWGRPPSGTRPVNACPLKPQQSMFLLRCHLLPKMYHGLVLREMKAKSLEQLDRQVRAQCANCCACHTILILPFPCEDERRRTGSATTALPHTSYAG